MFFTYQLSFKTYGLFIKANSSAKKTYKNILKKVYHRSRAFLALHYFVEKVFPFFSLVAVSTKFNIFVQLTVETCHHPLLNQTRPDSFTITCNLPKLSKYLSQ